MISLYNAWCFLVKKIVNKIHVIHLDYTDRKITTKISNINHVFVELLTLNIKIAIKMYICHKDKNDKLGFGWYFELFYISKSV